MTRNQIVSAIERRLGRRTGLYQDIVEEMVLAQARLERSRLPWFLVKAATGVACTSGQRTIALPTDFLRLYDESSIFIQDTNGTNDKRVEVADYDVLLADSSLAGTTVTDGKPTHLAMVGASFYAFPKPNAAYPLVFFYYGSASPTFDEETTVGAENAWAKYAPDVVIGEAGFHLAKALGQLQGIQEMKALRDEALARIWEDDIARKESGVEKFLGG